MPAVDEDHDAAGNADELAEDADLLVPDECEKEDEDADGEDPDEEEADETQAEKSIFPEWSWDHVRTWCPIRTAGKYTDENIEALAKQDVVMLEKCNVSAVGALCM